VTDLTDSTGATAKSYACDAYGSILESPGTLDQPYSYTGREFDAESYYRARYYNPAIGRFQNPDPLGLRGGLNLYAYVNNMPLRFLDPFGLYGTSDFVLHYCFEGGSPIDLGKVGLLGGFQNSASVSGAVGAFKEIVRAAALSKAKSLCGGCDKAR
jgi:RHS repeat-associated protein